MSQKETPSEVTFLELASRLNRLSISRAIYDVKKPASNTVKFEASDRIEFVPIGSYDSEDTSDEDCRASHDDYRASHEDCRASHDEPDTDAIKN